MFPANLDHLRVEWGKQGSYKTAWVTPRHDCLCPYKYGHGAAVRPQTNKAIWDGVIGLWGRVAPFLSPWCGKKELPTGVNLNHYDGSRSCVRWHSDNESFFGPRDSPKLIVSLSLGNPVEFKVRRVSDSVTSSITLDHGDVLVMDGSAQLEYLPREGGRSSKGGVSGPAEDLRPVSSEVEAGVNFRPAGGVRGQVAGLPGRSGEVRTHLPSTRRLLTPDSRHLDVGWASGNQWAGRRCVLLLGREFGC